MIQFRVRDIVATTSGEDWLRIYTQHACFVCLCEAPYLQEQRIWEHKKHAPQIDINGSIAAVEAYEKNTG